MHRTVNVVVVAIAILSFCTVAACSSEEAPSDNQNQGTSDAGDDADTGPDDTGDDADTGPDDAGGDGEIEWEDVDKSGWVGEAWTCLSPDDCPAMSFSCENTDTLRIEACYDGHCVRERSEFEEWLCQPYGGTVFGGSTSLLNSCSTGEDRDECVACRDEKIRSCNADLCHQEAVDLLKCLDEEVPELPNWVAYTGWNLDSTPDSPACWDPGQDYRDCMKNCPDLGDCDDGIGTSPPPLTEDLLSESNGE